MARNLAKNFVLARKKAATVKIEIKIRNNKMKHNLKFLQLFESIAIK